jgi:hypothetical protein
MRGGGLGGGPVAAGASTRPRSAAAVAAPRFAGASCTAGGLVGGSARGVKAAAGAGAGPDPAAEVAAGGGAVRAVAGGESGGVAANGAGDRAGGGCVGGAAGGGETVLPGGPNPRAGPLPGATVAVGRSPCAPRGANSSRTDDGGVTVIKPPHTAHRARTSAAGSFPGSTRKTDRHSGQVTFTSPPVPRPAAAGSTRRPARPAVRRPRADSAGGPLNTPSRSASLRSSSSPSPTR